MEKFLSSSQPMAPAPTYKLANGMISVTNGYLPNSADAVEAMLASANIGATWSSTSPDFGMNGTLIQHLKEHILHGNMMSHDILLYYTTYTLNGKKVEVVVKRVMAGRAVEHLGSPTLRTWTFTRRSLSGRTSESLAQTPSSRSCDGT
ncbi:Acetoacetyl-CoA synthetase [Lemmus lemmus]